MRKMAGREPTGNIGKAKEIAELVKAKGGRTYFVGGFVRDRVLGLPVKDVDIEIHGISVEALSEILKSLGEVITIGKSFGIYSLRGFDLDIALPRRENNTGRGHRDFEVYTDPFIGVEAAARRRDFTINALMEDVLSGEIVDCFGGLEDIRGSMIRHVDSESFIEDPLRVLRAAQFAARFDFDVAEETVELCKGIDLRVLPKERIENELKKGLCKSRTPSRFFKVLRDMEQLDAWFGELKDLDGLKQDPIYHPEGDVWTHTMLVLDKAVEYRDRTKSAFAFMLSALTHDFGKIVTSEEKNGRIHAYGHETEGLPLVGFFLNRITGEKDIKKYVLNMVELHMKPNMAANGRAKIKSTNKMFDEAIDPQALIWFSKIDKSCEAFKGEGLSNFAFLTERLAVFEETMSKPYVTGEDLIECGLKAGTDFKELLNYAHKLRLARVEKEAALKQVLAYAQKR